MTDEINRKETISRKKSSFLGLKYNDSTTNASYKELSQLPVKAQADYINTKSEFDTLIQGSEFNYLSGASIVAGGTITLTPATTLIENTLKKEKNSVVWQSMQDKGSITETAQLPQFNGPVLPTFKAAGGLSVQIPISEKDQNKVVIRDEILKLADQPGNAYLKEFVDRNDVDWNTVILAQKDWDYKSQGLTGAGAALIVIIVTIVTMGAGTAAAAGAAGAGAAAGGTTVGLGASMLGAAGITTTAAGAIVPSVLGAMANAAVTSLATQASIGLINNGGDIGATLKDLGSKDAVKNLVTSVATAGLLSQVSSVLDLPVNSTDFNDRLYVALINSTTSTLAQWTINGGSLSENLEQALLVGFSSVLHAEFAESIGKNLSVTNPDTLEYTIHKIAHMAAACAASAIVNKCEAGAIGAGVGEVIAELMTPEGITPFDLTQSEFDNIKNLSKLASGVVATSLGYDVTEAANMSDSAITNNSWGILLKAGSKLTKNVYEQVKKGGLNKETLRQLLSKETGKDIAVDILTGMVENVDTLLDPNASNADKLFAVADILIGIDFKGKNVGDLAQIKAAAQKQGGGVIVKKSYLDSPKQKVNSSEIGDLVRTPTKYAEDFKKAGGKLINIYTKEIWSKSNTTHSGGVEWKVGIGTSQPKTSSKITIDANTGKVLKVDK